MGFWTRSIFGVWVSFACLLSSVYAQETVPRLGEQDSRLSQKIRLAVGGRSIGDVLGLLTQQTGIRVTAARDVADDKVVIFTPKRPLRDTLEDLAALLSHQWESDSSDGTMRYRLVRNSKTKRLEAKLLEAEEGRLLALAGRYVHALSETPEQLKKRPEGDPLREALTHPTTRLAITAFASLTPDQRSQLRDNDFLSTPFANLGQQWQDSMRKMFMRIGAAIRQDTRPDAEDQEIDGLNQDTLQFQISEFHGSSTLSLMLDKAGIGTTFARIKNNQDWALPPHGNPYSGEKVAPDAVLPSVKASREAGIKAEWVEQLRRLAALSGQPVFADFYRSRFVNRGSYSNNPPEEPKAERIETQSTVAALDTLCKPVGYLWWSRPTGALLLRKRDWFVQRQYEVPDAWLLFLADTLQSRSGIATYGDLLNLRTLTRKQIAGLNSMAGDNNYTYGSSFVNGRAVHEIVALIQISGFLQGESIVRLPPNPDEQALKEVTREFERKTISVNQFSPEQRRLLPNLAGAFSARGHTLSTDDLAQLRISLQLENSPTVQKNTDAPPYQFVKVNFYINGTSSFSDYIELYLPLQFSEYGWGRMAIESE